MKSIRTVVTKVTTLVPRAVVALAIVAAVVTAGVSTSPSFAASTPASYSCGTYGSGNYSYTAGAADCGGAVGAPNTGFAAKLTQPSSLIAIIGSLLLIAAGIVMIVRARRKKQSISFSSSDN